MKNTPAGASWTPTQHDQGNSDPLLRLIIQRAVRQHPRHPPIPILIKHDIAVVFNEAALCERAVERAEGVL